MTDRELLDLAITKSGLSLRQFAQRLLARDARKVRRWRDGTDAIPEAAVRWLQEYLRGAA